MNKKLLVLLKKPLPYLLLCPFLGLQAQVGIGTATPHPSAQLEIQSTKGGMLIPRVTAAQKSLIPPPSAGLLVYQTDAPIGFWYHDGTAWTQITATGWKLTGDAGTTPGTTHFLGTTDNQALVFATNNTERMRVAENGNVGVGTNNPTAKLHIKGAAPAFRIEDTFQAPNRLFVSDVNGLGKWTTLTGTADVDWNFTTANKTVNDPISRIAYPVIIGKASDATPSIVAAQMQLDIDNGAATGTTFGIGDVEVITDGNSETQFSHTLRPAVNDSYSLGTISPGNRRWNTVYSVNGAIQTSDINFKNRITPLRYGLKEVMQLKPVRYRWIEEKVQELVIPENEREQKLGLIAQDLIKVLPEAVVTYGYEPLNDDKPDTFVRKDYATWGVQYEMLIPVLVKAKQEQDTKIQQLKAQAQRLLQEAQNLRN